MFGQSDVGAALASGDAGGGVQEPVAQGFGFAVGQVAVEEQVLGPGDQVDACEGELEPGGVERELSGRNRPMPVSLAQRMRSSTRAWARCLASRWASCPVGVLVAKA